jgi:superfamily II DNA or RNA helicase
MARLEELTVGASVIGLAGNSPVSIVAVKWHGNAVLEVTFKDVAGQLASQLVYREDEARLSIADGSLPWSFDADADLLRLTSEAYRINLAHIFDPYLAVHTSAIEPLPHQITAVYQEMLSRLPLRYILADDPGAGKTIMTGLFLKELLVRGDLKRCMIVSPGNLAEQWQDELYSKFNLRFEILTNDRIESAVTGNVFTEANLCIVRLDKLSRNEDIQDKLRVSQWDLIVCDEAHKMSATVFGGEIKYTKRFNLGRLLSSITRHFLLLTATPHNGKEEDFQLFLSLIDQDRFEGVARTGSQAVDVSDIMRRLVKEDLLKFDGTPLFPERLAYTVNYDLSPAEAQLYTAVTEYVQQEFNRADQLNSTRMTNVGFALTILQRRLASSPEAIYQSLKRRRERLESRLNEERLGKRSLEYILPSDSYDEYVDGDLPSSELEDSEEKVAIQASAAQTIAEIEAEINTLLRLERMANDVRLSGVDRKWDELSKLLQDDKNMYGKERLREKLIIFTEHMDTLRYLEAKIRSLIGNNEAVVTIHGGLLRNDRRKVEELFKQDKKVRILIATDAAGEGINLQRAHLMVNYDLPWNPNRIEQRFGRIHRIGQTEVCHLWNLVSRETREGMVFQRLFEKLEQEREALRGKVFDVLGKVSFDNKSLKDIILEAIRYGNDPAVRARLFQVVDHSLDRVSLLALLNEHALTEHTMDINQVLAIREDMIRMEAHKLQPHFIESFFLEAFTSVGGKIRTREKGRYEILFVPFSVRNRNMQIGFGEPILNRYERVCFDKPYCNIQGQIPAALVAPGHPLLNATIDLVLERNQDVMKRGAIFIDDSDYSTEPRLLFYVEDSVQDGIILSNGNKRIISKHIHFVEIKEDGSATNAGYAPYLDYRTAHEEEMTIIRSFLGRQSWLQANVEDIAIGYTISQVIPAHVSEVRSRKTKIIDKTTKAVKDRLTAEIQYWDFRSAELKEKEEAGITNARQNSKMAALQAEELVARLQKRLAELENEKLISAMPPLVVGGALVIPRGLLNKLSGKSDTFSADAMARRKIELAAMKNVMDIEMSLGYIPSDVSALKCGYDVESLIPEHIRKIDQEPLRLIEVKGRVTGATSVTVTKNEILTAFNKPEEYILAIVEVGDDSTATAYLKKPFRERPDFAATSVNYDIADLMASSEVILQRGK